MITKEKFIVGMHAYIIPNNYDHRLSSFLELFEEIKIDFPEITPEDIECRTVTESRYCRRCPVVMFKVEQGTIMPGWENRDELGDLFF